MRSPLAQDAKLCAEAIQSIPISNCRTGSGYPAKHPIEAGKLGNVCTVVNRAPTIMESPNVNRRLTCVLAPPQPSPAALKRTLGRRRTVS
jgi:hypothetical protein